MQFVLSISSARINDDLSMEFLCSEYLTRTEKSNKWSSPQLVEETRKRWISSLKMYPHRHHVRRYLRGLDKKKLDLLSRGNDPYIQSLIREARNSTNGGRHNNGHDNKAHDNNFERSGGRQERRPRCEPPSWDPFRREEPRSKEPRREEPRYGASREPPVDPKTQKCRDFLKAASLDPMRLNRLMVVARCYRIDYGYHSITLEVCGTDSIEDVKYFFQARVGIDVSRCSTKWYGVQLPDSAKLSDINVFKSCVLSFIEPCVRFGK